MEILREELDAELVAPRFVAAPSEWNTHPINCSSCGRTLYADKPSYDAYVRSLEYDPTNQFICDDCNEAALEENR